MDAHSFAFYHMAQLFTDYHKSLHNILCDMCDTLPAVNIPVCQSDN